MITEFNKQRLNNLLSSALKDQTHPMSSNPESQSTMKISRSLIGENITQNFTVNSHNNHFTLWFIILMLSAIAMVFF